MKIIELSEYELENINGGSEASDDLCFLLGAGVHYLWKGLCALGESCEKLNGVIIS